MTLIKELPILELLTFLDLKKRGWIVVDHWEGDLCAIGIAAKSHPRRLVYISTFGKLKGRYDYQCEVPGGHATKEYCVVSSAHDITLNDLLRAMEEHLKKK